MALLEEIRKVNEASRQLSLVDGDTINALLMDLAQETEKEIDFIVQENQKDLDRMDPSDPKYDRLLLTPERIKSIANDIRNVAALKSPLGIILEEKHQPNGLLIKKIRVPLGVIGIIYESRPNVTFDVFALCIKSGNACVLKGSKDAHDSNVAIVSIIKRVIAKHTLPTSILFLLPPEREATSVMLNAVKYIDLVIPRGSQGLINFVRENSKIPTIETGAGICHTYFDEFADVEKGRKIIFNAKTRRVSVCNALDCLIIHSSRLSDLARIGELLQESYTELFADERSYHTLADGYPSSLLNKATDESFGTEFLSNKMAIKTVDSIEEAIAHIFAHSSKHSEAIISENQDRINQFLMSVDASAVYANTSTAFTDGAQFGLGAEIGISTQKLHARGPMALDELTSYKWIVIGDGQVRA